MLYLMLHFYILEDTAKNLKYKLINICDFYGCFQNSIADKANVFLFVQNFIVFIIFV